MFVFRDRHDKKKDKLDALPMRKKNVDYFLAYYIPNVVKGVETTSSKNLQAAKSVYKIYESSSDQQKVVDYFSVNSIKIDPLAGIYRIFPGIYPKLIVAYADNPNFNPQEPITTSKLIINSHLSYTLNIINNFKHQLPEKLKSNAHKYLYISDIIQTDGKQVERAEFTKDVELYNTIQPDAIKRMYRFLFCVLYELITDCYNKSRKSNLLDSKEGFKILEELLCRETYTAYQLERENKAKTSTAAKTRYAYYHIYDSSKCLGKGEITKLTPSNINEKMVTDILRQDLTKYCVYFRDNPELQAHEELLGDEGICVYIRYLAYLFELILGRPIINPDNVEDYTQEDIEKQVLHNEEGTALGDIISMKVISPEILDMTQSFEEWLEIYKQPQTTDYVLEMAEPINIIQPKVQLIDSIANIYNDNVLQYGTNTVNNVDVDKLLYLANQKKLWSYSNLKNPYDELYADHLNRLILTQPKISKTNPVTLYSQLRNTLKSKEADYIFANIEPTAKQERNNQYLKVIHNMVLTGTFPRSTPNTDVSIIDEIKEYIDTEMEKVVQVHFNKMIQYYRENNINTRYLVRKNELLSVLRQSITFNGEQDTLMFLDTIQTFPIYLCNGLAQQAKRESMQCFITKDYQALIQSTTNKGELTIIKLPIELIKEVDEQGNNIVRLGYTLV